MTASCPHDELTVQILEYIQTGLGVCDAFDRHQAARENVKEALLCHEHAETAARADQLHLARVYRRQVGLYLAYAQAWLTPGDA